MGRITNDSVTADRTWSGNVLTHRALEIPTDGCKKTVPLPWMPRSFSNTALIKQSYQTALQTFKSANVPLIYSD